MNWLNSLPSHLHPSKTIAKELDDFRESIGCPDEPFGMRILGSGWATRRTQKLTYDKVRTEDSTATEAELVERVYEMRKLTSQTVGQNMPTLPASCKTFDAFVEFVIRTEASHAMPDPFGWGAKIDSLLAKE